MNVGKNLSFYFINHTSLHSSTPTELKKDKSIPSLKLKLSSSLLSWSFNFFFLPPPRGFSYYATPGLKGSNRKQI